MKTLTIGELYAAVEGKTERSEIEAVLTRASIAVLKEYLNNEAGYKAYDGMSTWRKADYVEAATETTLDKIAFEEEHDKLIQQIAEENASASCEPLTHSQIVFGVKYAASSAAHVKDLLMECETENDLYNVYVETTGKEWRPHTIEDEMQYGLMWYGDQEELKDWMSSRMSEDIVKYRNPEVLTLEEVKEATSDGKFAAMGVSEKMKYLDVTAMLHHGGRWGHDCGYIDLVMQCQVSELEEIARQKGMEIPARLYRDKKHLERHMRWYMNVKMWYVDVQPEEEEYVVSLNNPESTLTEVSVGVEKYESGKLTEDELSEILESASAETLREYILKEIARAKGRKNAA